MKIWIQFKNLINKEMFLQHKYLRNIFVLVICILISYYLLLITFNVKNKTLSTSKNIISEFSYFLLLWHNYYKKDFYVKVSNQKKITLEIF